MSVLSLLLVATAALTTFASIFNTFPTSQTGVTESNGLSDEELSLQFSLAYLSYLTEGTWLKQYGLNENGNQLDISSVRYQLAFMAYSTPLLSYKTPAYRQLGNKILYNFIERMIDNKTWATETDYWWGPDSYHETGASCTKPIDDGWEATNVWPDPVAYQNIMYSGHLAQMVTLFEAVSGNDTLSVDGWNFIYNETMPYMKYNTSMLLDILANMQNDKNNKYGGIPCEPFRVFTECNQHQQVAFNLYNNVIKYNENYENAKEKWTNYFTEITPYNDTVYTNGTLQFEGWVKGIYYQEAESYFIDNVVDEEWNLKHLECGWDGASLKSPHGSFVSIPNSPPRDTWVSSIAYLYLDDDKVNSFVCNDGLIKLFENRLWKYEEEYEGYVLNNHVKMGICWGTSMYTMAAKQCIPYNENAGYNGTAINERVTLAQNWLINKYGSSLDNPYYLNAPYLDVKRCDNGFGSSLIDTGNLISGIALYNDSWRKIHSEPWPQLQTTIELINVDYPKIMVRYAKVESNGYLKFEVFVSSSDIVNNAASTTTELTVQLSNGELSKIVQDGHDVSTSDFSVVGNIVTITANIMTTTSSVFEVYTTAY